MVELKFIGIECFYIEKFFFIYNFYLFIYNYYYYYYIMFYYIILYISGLMTFLGHTF